MNVKPIRSILLHVYAGASIRSVSEAVGLSKTTVQKYVDIVRTHYPRLEDALKLSDVALNELVCPPRRAVRGFYEPDWGHVYECNRRRGRQHRSLQMLWEEYVRNTPDGQKYLSYKSFCKNLQNYRRNLPAEYRDLEMMFDWLPGDVVQIDYSGDGLFYTDISTGKAVKVEVFVAVLPYSNYAFAYATPHQERADWLDAQVKLFEFLGGVPRNVFLDNAKSLVNRSDKHNPKICREYMHFCDHYHTVPVAMRPYRPRDKGKVEGHVGIVQRRILNPLLDRQFFSIEEINCALRKEVEAFNARKFTTPLRTSRIEVFEEEEKITLLPLPVTPYQVGCTTRIVSVGRDYRFRFDSRWYSVPSTYARKKVKVVLNPIENVLTIFDPLTGERIDQFYPNDKLKEQVRLEHMPEAHRMMMKTKDQLRTILQAVGPQSAALTDVVCARNNGHTCMKLLRSLNSMRRSLGDDLFEQCAKQTMNRPNPSYESFMQVANLAIDGGNDKQYKEICSDLHSDENVRGSAYYDQEESK